VIGSMHRLFHLRLAVGVGAALLGLPALPARGDDGAPVRPPAAAAPAPAERGDLLRLEVFLDQHPFVEARLRENPNLVNDPAFRRNHPVFAEFVARHPGFLAELAASPRWFIHRELIRRSATPVTVAEVAEFDRFLDRHTGIERQLVLRPQLLRTPEFLNRQPELREYLGRHPGVGRAAEPRPGALLRRER